MLAEQYEVDLNSTNSNRAVNLVLQNFPVALAFVYALIADSSVSTPVPGGANSAWDLKVAFHASRGASLSGIPVLVVSDDKRLLRAAREAGEPMRVARMNEYQSLLTTAGGIEERAGALRTDP